MIRIYPEDTQWALAGRVEPDVLARIARSLPKELQANGSKIVAGKDGFAALLVFGGFPSERLAKQLLLSVTPVYLLDFNDDAPATLKLDREKTRVTETRMDEHPADFLEERGIVAPGYADEPSPVLMVGLIEATTPAEARNALNARGAEPDPQVEFRVHPRGVLIVGDRSSMTSSMIAMKLKRRAYDLFRNPEDGWFTCVVHDPSQTDCEASYSPVRPDPNSRPLDNILGETTLEGILRVLEIPGELLGL